MKKINSFILSIVLMFFGQIIFAQNKSVTYSNPRNFYGNKDISNAIKDAPLKGRVFLEPKVNEITLNTDSTFDFWSRPNISCFTWREYKGTWKKSKDSVLFYDNYEIVELDMKATYKKDSTQRYHIAFATNKKSDFKNKQIKVEYMYDYDAHLTYIEKTIFLNGNNVIEIPFKDIPDHNKLASIRVEYLLNNFEKRYGFLTQNETVNVRHGDLPNVINVEVIETPKKEMVYRTIKALVKKDTMIIVGTIKNKTTLADYNPEIMFEKRYALEK